MKLSSLIATALAAAVLVGVGCKKSEEAAPVAAQPAAPAPAAQKDPNEVVASVNETQYRRKDLDKVVDALIRSQNIPAEQADEARRYFEQSAVRSFVMKTLILGEAKRQNVTATDEDRKAQMDKLAENLTRQNKTVDQFFKESPLGEEAMRAEFADILLIDKLLQSAVVDKIAVTDEDVQNVIGEITRKNTEIAEKNNTLDATNKERREKILALKKQLAEGADFAELAKANSDCPSKEQGGSLGEFTRGQMVKPFEDAAFSQPLNQVGDIVETDFGYHLIKVAARTPAAEAVGDQPAKPETATASHILVKIEKPQQAQPVPTVEQVKEHLKRQKSQEAVQKYLAGLKEAAKIETVFPDLAL